MGRGGGVQVLCVYPKIPDSSLYLAERRSRVKTLFLSSKWASGNSRFAVPCHVQQCTAGKRYAIRTGETWPAARDPAKPNGRCKYFHFDCSCSPHGGATLTARRI